MWSGGGGRGHGPPECCENYIMLSYSIPMTVKTAGCFDNYTISYDCTDSPRRVPRQL